MRRGPVRREPEPRETVRRGPVRRRPVRREPECREAVRRGACAVKAPARPGRTRRPAHFGGDAGADAVTLQPFWLFIDLSRPAFFSWS